jgi:hypothetical protein
MRQNALTVRERDDTVDGMDGSKSRKQNVVEEECVCVRARVCVCARACACVCVCVCVMRGRSGE